jgi:L-serine dehydratase
LSNYSDPQTWLEEIRLTEVKFRQILKWVSCFALSVNEVNAALGRIVTAPTNGKAGVIPSVLMYYLALKPQQVQFRDRQFVVAGEISIFKKGSPFRQWVVVRLR